MFPNYVFNYEDPDCFDYMRNVDLYQGENGKFTVEDLYRMLQHIDMREALLYASKNFEKSLDSPVALENFIKQIHRRVGKHLVLACVEEEYVNSGDYRKDRIVIRSSFGEGFIEIGEKVQSISQKMRELCNRLYQKYHFMVTNHRFSQMREMAVEALLEICRIHPFSDGNGRVARILCNCILMKANHPPVVFKNNNKDEFHKIVEDFLLGKNKSLVEFSKSFEKITTYEVDYKKDPIDPKINVGMKLSEDENKVMIFNVVTSEVTLLYNWKPVFYLKLDSSVAGNEGIKRTLENNRKNEGVSLFFRGLINLYSPQSNDTSMKQSVAPTVERGKTSAPN